MRRIRTALMTGLAALAVAAPSAAADEWRETVRPGAMNDGGAAIADLGGVPHLAWSEQNGAALQIRVAKLDGGEWEQVGPVVNADPTNDAFSPRLTVNGDELWITWLEDDDNGSAVVHVARLHDGAWVGDAVDIHPSVGPGDNRFYAGQGELVFLDGVAYLGVLEDNGVEFDFDLMRLEGGDWVHAAGGQIGNRGFFISRGFDLEPSGGRLYIRGGSFSGNSVVWRLAENGSEWEDVGHPEPGTEASTLTDVAGILHATYSSDLGDPGPHKQAVARLVNGSWEQVGPAVVTAPANEPWPALARRVTPVAGVLHVPVEPVVSQEPFRRDLTVVRLAADASAWEPVGAGTINDSSDMRFHGLAAVKGVPYVAWSEFDGSAYELRVARFEVDPPPDPPGNGNPGNGTPGNGDPNPGPPPNVPGPPASPGECGFTITGTQLADSLAGDDRRNEIVGLAGTDRLFGLGHADCLFGGAGNDLLDGGAGNDELFGQAGDDRLKGGADSDELSGGAGDDKLTGGDDEDELLGGAGRDVLISGHGYDVVTGGSGNDVIDARGAGFDRIDCGPGRDRVKNASPSDRLRNCERIGFAR